FRDCDGNPDNACELDVSADSANCGGCGNVCGALFTCVSSSCVCDAGLAYCQGTCIDVTSDHENCGGCGTVCGDYEECISSACVASPGTINLTASSANGSAGFTTLMVDSSAGFTVGQEILIHQTQGTNAGTWEQATIVAVSPASLTLDQALLNDYVSDSGNDH